MVKFKSLETNLDRPMVFRDVRPKISNNISDGRVLVYSIRDVGRWSSPANSVIQIDLRGGTDTVDMRASDR